MPTSVGPNTKGEENLVFGYDLGDVSNSYKGEPVQNLQTVGEGNVYTSVGTTNTTAELVDMVTPFGNKAWKITIPASGTNGYSNTRAQGPTVVINRDDTPYFHGAYVWMSDSDYALWILGSNYIYKYSTGSNGMGQWQHYSAFDKKDRNNRTWKLWGNVTSLSNGGTGNQYHTFFKNGTLTNDLVFYIVAPMWGVNKLHPVQFTAGTRSATQGLQDLTGNSTIDLTNVSFDSNAQMTFDGSSDHIDLGTALNSYGSVSIELVFKTSTATDMEMLLSWGTPNTSNYSGIGIGNWASGIPDESLGVVANGQTLQMWVQNGHTAYKDNNYHHAVVTLHPGQNKVFVDGVEQTMYYQYGSINTDTGAFTISNNQVSIGRYVYNSGARLNGKLPLAKIYNRALTASEVKSNYNAIKGRFNI